MTYYLTALENTRARLIVKEARFSGVGAKADADAVADLWEAQGLIVVRREEG